MRLSATTGSGGSPQSEGTPASCRTGTWPQRGRVPLTAAAGGASRSARRRRAAVAPRAAEKRRPRRRRAQAGARASVTPRWHVATTRPGAAHRGCGGAQQKRMAASRHSMRWPQGGRGPSTAAAGRRSRNARMRDSATARGRDAAESRAPRRRGQSLQNTSSTATSRCQTHPPPALLRFPHIPAPGQTVRVGVPVDIRIRNGMDHGKSRTAGSCSPRGGGRH